MGEPDINAHGQPVGPAVAGWTPPPRDFPPELVGDRCRLQRLSAAAHAADLFAANTSRRRDENWTYLAYGPFDDLASYRDWVESAAAGTDPLFYAILDRGTGKAVGVASFLRISPNEGSIEVGHIHFSPMMQGTPLATEAMYLMMATAFSMGYRRYEWKCDALNEPSRKAALRLGFTFEGIFRKATVVKGRNRDTAWYSITDDEWPAIRRAMEAWLAPDNFDEAGRQKRSLSQMTGAARDRD